jgi:hypothetical protein
MRLVAAVSALTSYACPHSDRANNALGAVDMYTSAECGCWVPPSQGSALTEGIKQQRCLESRLVLVHTKASNIDLQTLETCKSQVNPSSAVKVSCADTNTTMPCRVGSSNAHTPTLSSPCCLWCAVLHSMLLHYHLPQRSLELPAILCSCCWSSRRPKNRWPIWHHSYTAAAVLLYAVPQYFVSPPYHSSRGCRSAGVLPALSCATISLYR